MNTYQQAFLDEVEAIKQTMEQVCALGNKLAMERWIDIDSDDFPTLKHSCNTAACIIGWHATRQKVDMPDDAILPCVVTLAFDFSNKLDAKLGAAINNPAPIFAYALFIYASSPRDRKHFLEKLSYFGESIGALSSHPFNQTDAKGFALNETPQHAVSYLQAIHDAFTKIWSKDSK